MKSLLILLSSSCFFAQIQILQPTGPFNSPIRVTAHNGSYTILASDMTGNSELTCNTSVTWVLPQAGTSGFESSKWFVANNIGSGVCTINTTTSTFSGGGTSGSTMTVQANSSAKIISNSGNWIVEAGGSGGGGSTGSYNPPTVTVSGAVMTIGANCTIPTPCPIGIGSTTYLFNTSSTATLSSGTGVGWVYVDYTGQLTIGHNLGSSAVTCSAGCTQVNGITAFPSSLVQPSVPIYRWTATSGSWDVSGGTNYEAALNVQAVLTSAGMPAPGGDVTGTYAATLVTGVNGAAVPLSATCTGTNSSGQLISASCGGVIPSKCTSSASPAVCGSSSAGFVAIPVGGTNPTLIVNTTAVTSTSAITLTLDASLGTALGVTCQTVQQVGTGYMPWVSARSAGTSFTITNGGSPATNPVCITYVIQ